MMPLPSPPTPVGNNKAVAGGAAGAATIILMWILDKFFNLEIPAEVGSAATTLIGTVAVWVTPHGQA